MLLKGFGKVQHFKMAIRGVAGGDPSPAVHTLRDREGKGVVFTTLIAWFGFNPHPGHVVR